MPKPISAEFNFEPHYLEVNGSQIHYVDEGEGAPVLFLHGNPTSSYLWRNIIPHIVPHARCIAPDLIGMGKSDKPEIDYRFFTHYDYLESFIEKMGLIDITLVVHDWGSGLGFHYASLHPENIRGLAFMEAILRPVKWKDMPLPFWMAFRIMRTPGIGWLMVSGMNGFINRIMPQSIVRKLSPEEIAHYKEPYPTATSRKPVRQWPLEVPIDGKPADVTQAVKAYSRWLQEAGLPKILFYAHPGGLIPKETVKWCEENMTNLTTVDIGKGIHYLQEDNPHKIGEDLAEWFTRLNG